MDYRINYSAIKQWLQANPNHSKQTILDALGKKDYNKMNKIYEGELPMDIEDMVRVMNAFQIPMAVMFFNEDDDPLSNMPFRHSTPMVDLPMPKGGFPKKSANKTGPRRTSPIVEHKQQSNIPGMTEADLQKFGKTESRAEPQGSAEPAPPTHHTPDMQTQILNTLKHIDRNVSMLAEDKYRIGMAAEDVR